jgi:hypothetical protein
MHRVLKQALGQAVRWDILNRNPAEAVDPPKVERSSMQTYDINRTAELIEAMRKRACWSRSFWPFCAAFVAVN